MNRTLFKQLFISTPLCLLTCESVCVCGLSRRRFVTNFVCQWCQALYKALGVKMLYTCCQSHALSPPLSPPTFILICIWGNSLLRRARACQLLYRWHSFYQLHPWRLINTNSLSPTRTARSSHPSTCLWSCDALRHFSALWQQEASVDLQETEKGKDSSD